MTHTTSGMSFRQVQMVSKRAKMMMTKEVELPQGNIADVLDNYKYLLIEGSAGPEKSPESEQDLNNQHLCSSSHQIFHRYIFSGDKYLN